MDSLSSVSGINNDLSDNDNARSVNLPSRNAVILQRMALKNEPNREQLHRLIGLFIPVMGAGAGVLIAPSAYPLPGALLGGACAAGLVWFWNTRLAKSRQSRAKAVDANVAKEMNEAPLAAFPVPILMFDEDGKVTQATREAEALLQRTLVGLPISLVFRTPTILDAVEEALIRDVDETFDFRIRRPRDMTLTATVRTLPPGGRERVSLMLQDNTDRVLVEGARSDFIANASHELRTPLAAISGIVETLQGTAKDDPTAREKFLGMMHKQTDRMTRLVNDLLSLSRIEADENIQPPTHENLVALLREVLSSVQPLAEKAGANLETAIPSDSLIVQGSRDELMQVFVNLIENAIKYAGDFGPVRVTADLEGNEARVSVSDRGPGIDPDHIPRLTERFYRVDAGASRARGGTGLGLAIVKHIVSRHRGTLKISSKPGEGTDFSVILPLADSGPVPTS